MGEHDELIAELRAWATGLRLDPARLMLRAADALSGAGGAPAGAAVSPATEAAWPEWLTPEYGAIHTALENEMKRALDHCYASSDAAGMAWTMGGLFSCSASNLMGLLKRLGMAPPPVGDVEELPMPEGERCDPDDLCSVCDGAGGVFTECEACGGSGEASGFRMLEPHEIAAAMAFPVGYIPTEGLTKRDRVKLAGNAVTPPVMAWILGRVLQALEAAAG